MLVIRRKKSSMYYLVDWLYTPARSLSILSNLEIDIFDLKMMMKSGLEFFLF